MLYWESKTRWMHAFRILYFSSCVFFKFTDLSAAIVLIVFFLFAWLKSETVECYKYIALCHILCDLLCISLSLSLCWKIVLFRYLSILPCFRCWTYVFNQILVICETFFSLHLSWMQIMQISLLKSIRYILVKQNIDTSFYLVFFGNYCCLFLFSRMAASCHQSIYLFWIVSVCVCVLVYVFECLDRFFPLDW